MHFSRRTSGTGLLLNRSVFFLVCQCSWMKSKLTAFCLFTVCVEPNLTFSLYLCKGWEWQMSTTCWVLRLQHQGTSLCLTSCCLTSLEPLNFCVCLTCIFPNFVLNVSKPLGVFKNMNSLEENQQDFISNEAKPF